MNKELEQLIYPTAEEKKWVKLLSSGKKAHKIAEDLGLNKNTFAYKLKFLRVKYNCSNTTQLISFFLRNQFID